MWEGNETPHRDCKFQQQPFLDYKELQQQVTFALHYHKAFSCHIAVINLKCLCKSAGMKGGPRHSALTPPTKFASGAAQMPVRCASNLNVNSSHAHITSVLNHPLPPKVGPASAAWPRCGTATASLLKRNEPIRLHLCMHSVIVTSNNSTFRLCVCP